MKWNATATAEESCIISLSHYKKALEGKWFSDDFKYSSSSKETFLLTEKLALLHNSALKYSTKVYLKRNFYKDCKRETWD